MPWCSGSFNLASHFHSMERPCPESCPRRFCTRSLVVEVVVGSSRLLLPVLRRVQLVYTGPIVGWVSSKGNVKVRQELIHSRYQRLWCIGSTVNRRTPLINNDLVSQVGCHDEIMLNNKCSFLGMKNESFDNLWGNNTLLWIKICTWFIDQIDICRLNIYRSVSIKKLAVNNVWPWN